MVMLKSETIKLVHYVLYCFHVKCFGRVRILIHDSHHPFSYHVDEDNDNMM